MKRKDKLVLSKGLIEVPCDSVSVNFVFGFCFPVVEKRSNMGGSKQSHAIREGPAPYCLRMFDMIATFF